MTETAPRITTEKCAPGRKEHEPTLYPALTMFGSPANPNLRIRDIRVECIQQNCLADLVQAGHPIIHDAINVYAALQGIIPYGDNPKWEWRDLRSMNSHQVARIAWAMARAITEHSVTAPDGPWSVSHDGGSRPIIHVAGRPVGRNLLVVGQSRVGAVLRYSQEDDDAQLIVTAVNAYAPMRAALRKGVALVRDAIDQLPGQRPELIDRLDNWQADVQVDLLSPWESTDDTL